MKLCEADEAMQLVHARLEEWARWSAADRGPSEPRSILANWVMGDRYPDAPRNQPLPFDADALEVERAVLMLERVLVEVVTSYYLGIGTAKQKAKGLHLSVRTYYRHLDRALLSLAPHLGITVRRSGCTNGVAICVL